MKTTALIFLLPVIAVAAQNGPGNRVGPARAEYPADCPRTDCPLNAPSAATPTSLAAADLAAALDEERVAQDLYRVAAERWQLPVFSHIAAAEARHAAAFERLATSANVPIPTAQTGVYATPEARRLHEQLLPLMNSSAEGALKAAALLEETHIGDLRALAARATDEPTRTMLAQIQVASQRHLAAFVGNLRSRGVTYQPQVLSAEEFAATVAADSPRGRGRGYRGGR